MRHGIQDTTISDNVVLVRCQNRRFNWSLPHQPETMPESTASAFWMRYAGRSWLVTCYHAIGDSYHITIESTKDGAIRTPCHVLFGCPILDIAVLEPDTESTGVHVRTPFTPLQLRSSPSSISGPPIGCATLAVGFPLGQTHLKITRGILSGQQNDMYQTDAPINPGNSGGPLLWEGRVIGVNARMSFMANDVGYAIPIHRVLFLLDSGFRDPCIPFPRNWGVSYNPPSDCSKHGVEIISVYPDQLMSSTSLRPGDVWTHVDGSPISSLGELSKRWLGQKLSLANYLTHIPFGHRVQIRFRRGKQSLTDVFVMRPEHPAIVYHECFNERAPIPYLYAIGLVMVPVCENILRHRGTLLKNTLFRTDVEDPILEPTVDLHNSAILQCADPENWSTGRIIVTNVLKGSRVDKHHLFKIGDILVRINGKPVHTIADVLRSFMRPSRTILLTMASGRKAVFDRESIRKEELVLQKLHKYTPNMTMF